MQCVTLLFCFVLVSAEEYDNKLTKLWSVSGTSRGGSVINVTSASILIHPSKYANQPSRSAKLLRPYAFKPRAIPIPVRREEPQVERNVYYTDDAKKYKSEILFPGNYYSISKEKSNSTQQFRPQAIPLIRNDEFQRRSLDVSEEPIIEEPEEDEPDAQRRSIVGEIFGVDDDNDDDDEEGEYEIEELDDGEKELKEGAKHKNKRKTKLKPKKLKKYMLPLLLAYKLKYFALVPVMIGGLILLVGATGMAGFFFALFAAVMGLQKGGY